MPGLLAFVRDPIPDGAAPWRATATLLRLLTWTFLATAAWGAGYMLWMLVSASQHGLPPGWLPVFGAAMLAGVVAIAGMGLALAWWGAYAFERWCARTRTGYNHAVWLAAAVLLLQAPMLTDWSWESTPWHIVVLPALLALQAALALALLVATLMRASRREFQAPAVAT